MNNICAVVVTYNRKDILKKNIDCLLAQTKECDVLIINNASTDGTESMILNDYRDERIHYKNTGSNLGGAGGFEYGIGEASKSGYEYIWIMDDDTWPSEDALERFLDADETLGGKWGFLSGAVYWTDNKPCKANRPKTGLASFVKDKDYEGGSKRILMGSFVSMLVKNEVIKTVGLPIGDYFIWTDDYEFSGRIARKLPCYFIPSSRVIHAMKSNVKANVVTDDVSRMNRYECLYRNDVHCYRQFGLRGWCYILFKDLYMSLKIILKSKDNKKERLGTIRRGYKKGLKYNPEIKY